MPTARKRKSKARTRASVRYAPPKRLSAHMTLLLLVAAMALSFVAYNLRGDVGGSVQAAGQSLPALQYRPERVATASLGDAFIRDDVRYEVRGAVSRGSTSGFQKAKGKFVEVAIGAENIGAVPATLDVVSLIDGSGNLHPQLPQFSADGTSYSEAIVQGLKPGSGGAFFALFDVASDAAEFGLSFHGRDGEASRIVWLGL